jgi:hypothetical protein
MIRRDACIADSPSGGRSLQSREGPTRAPVLGFHGTKRNLGPERALTIFGDSVV